MQILIIGAGISLVRALHVPAPRVNGIVRERRDVIVDTALKFARYVGATVQFWLNLQPAYDLLRPEIAGGWKIAREVVALTGAA